MDATGLGCTGEGSSTFLALDAAARLAGEGAGFLCLIGVAFFLGRRLVGVFLALLLVAGGFLAGDAVVFLAEEGDGFLALVTFRGVVVAAFLTGVAPAFRALGGLGGGLEGVEEAFLTGVDDAFLTGVEDAFLMVCLTGVDDAFLTGVLFEETVFLGDDFLGVVLF